MLRAADWQSVDLKSKSLKRKQAHFELLRMRAEGDQGKDAGETGDKLSTVTPQKAEAAGGGGTPSPFKPGGMVTPVAAYPLTPSPVVETPAQGQHFNSPATPAVFNQQPVTPVVTSASIGSPESTHIPPAPPPRNNCRGGGAGGEGENPGKIRGEGVDTLVGDILCDAKALVRGRWPVSKRGPHPLSAVISTPCNPRPSAVLSTPPEPKTICGCFHTPEPQTIHGNFYTPDPQFLRSASRRDLADPPVEDVKHGPYDIGPKPQPEPCALNPGPSSRQ